MPRRHRWTPKEWFEAIRQQMNREPSPYDSHPRPVDRIEWVLALAAEGVPPQPDDQDEVWSLFEDREDLERRLTDEIRRHVADQHGATIPKEPAEPTPASV